MKAARLHAYGEPDQIHYDEVPRPAPGAGEVLVEVAASSLNPVELYVRQGYLAEMLPLELPTVLGLDLAGNVVEAGAGVSAFQVGDRVIGKLPLNAMGSNAEFVTARPEQLAKLSAGVAFAAGAALPLAGLTGRQAVNAVAPKAGDRVLVTGALGSVGRAAVQYLQELGAVPVAGVRASRVKEAASLGVEAFAIGEGGEEASFDGAIDTVGGEITTAAIALVRDGGTLATVARVPEGANADARIQLVSVNTADDAAMLQQIADAAARGELSIPAARTFPFSQAGEGHKLAASGQAHGKIVFVP